MGSNGRSKGPSASAAEKEFLIFQAFPQSIGSYDKGEVLFSLNPAIPYPGLIPAPNDHRLSSGGFGRR
jgi:hypothetical protein